MYIFIIYHIISFIIYHISCIYILSYILTLKFEVCSYTMFQRVLYRTLVPGLPRSVVCVCMCAGRGILKIYVFRGSVSKPFILECVGTLLGLYFYFIFLWGHYLSFKNSGIYYSENTLLLIKLPIYPILKIFPCWWLASYVTFTSIYCRAFRLFVIIHGYKLCCFLPCSTCVFKYLTGYFFGKIPRYAISGLKVCILKRMLVLTNCPWVVFLICDTGSVLLSVSLHSWLSYAQSDYSLIFW